MIREPVSLAHDYYYALFLFEWRAWNVVHIAVATDLVDKKNRVGPAEDDAATAALLTECRMTEICRTLSAATLKTIDSFWSSKRAWFRVVGDKMFLKLTILPWFLPLNAVHYPGLMLRNAWAPTFCKWGRFLGIHLRLMKRLSCNLCMRD